MSVILTLDNDSDDDNGFCHSVPELTTSALGQGIVLRKKSMGIA